MKFQRTFKTLAWGEAILWDELLRKVIPFCSDERRGALKHAFFKHLRYLLSTYIMQSCFIDVLLQAQVLSKFQDKTVGHFVVSSSVRHRLL